jgi:hypothetical protein
MKKLYTLGLCLLLCLFLPHVLKADTLEVAGAEMTYKWISGNKYEVQLNIYTKCNFTTLDSVWIKVSSPDTNFKPYKKLASLQDMGKVRKTCITESTCENPNNVLPGFRKWTATTDFTLTKDKYCQYFFSWDTCCRTKIITTGPALNHFYIDAYMRICEDEKNSSPYFTENPFFTSAVNYCNQKRNTIAGEDDVNYNYKFDLTPPRQSQDSAVKFDQGYSFDKPFSWTVPSARPCSELKINDTGIVSFESDRQDVSPVALINSKYDKNGVLQSRINRDIVYMLMGFPENQAPIISGINGGSNTSYQFHGGSSVCFTIHSFDIDDNDSVFMSATNLPTGATLDVEVGKRFPKGAFCWTPKEEYARQEPYIFTVTVKDNNYGCSDIDGQGISSRNFAMYVCPNHDCTLLGINNQSISTPLHIYPQPAQNAVYIELPESRVDDLQLTDMAGRIFLTDYVWEGNTLKVKTENIPQGSYMLKIISGNSIYNSKLIIQK